MPTEKFNIQHQFIDLIESGELFAASQTKSGQKWIKSLPSLISNLCTEWDLEVVGKPSHGYLGVVLPVRRGTNRYALKLASPESDIVEEAATLTSWSGNGAVQVVAANLNQGALLLEWLDNQQSLSSIPLPDAVAIAGQLYNRLAIPAPATIRPQAAMAADIVKNMQVRWRNFGRNIPRTYLDRAVQLATDLATPSESLLINYDLHYDNVLAGKREPWLVIDPKVVAGDKAFGIAQLLWTRFEPDGAIEWRFELLVDSAEIDPQMARAWSFVRVIDYWLWALSVGFTEDPLRCRAITNWLTS